jgi:hypothetical protein
MPAPCSDTVMKPRIWPRAATRQTSQRSARVKNPLNSLPLPHLEHFARAATDNIHSGLLLGCSISHLTAMSPSMVRANAAQKPWFAEYAQNEPAKLLAVVPARSVRTVWLSATDRLCRWYARRRAPGMCSRQ